MTISVVKRPRWLQGIDATVAAAFAAIYVLWGATFLAIRIAVLEVPPLLSSGLRFSIAGALLYGVMRLRGEPVPSPVEWRSMTLSALCMFVITYAALFWAEQYVPSGPTAVIEATIPISAVVLETFVFRQQPFRWRLAFGVLLGFSGVATMLLEDDPGAGFPKVPCLVILAAGVTWSFGAVLTRTLPRPRSAPLTAGAQMLIGGLILLAWSVVSGELTPLPRVSLRAGLALGYLIVAGSLVGFTAYLWLLTRMPATRVASHAYVNPLVAVALGYFMAGEVLTTRVLLGATLVVAAVFLTVTTPAQPAPQPAFRTREAP